MKYGLYGYGCPSRLLEQRILYSVSLLVEVRRTNVNGSTRPFFDTLILRSRLCARRGSEILSLDSTSPPSITRPWYMRDIARLIDHALTKTCALGLPCDSTKELLSLQRSSARANHLFLPHLAHFQPILPMYCTTLEMERTSPRELGKEYVVAPMRHCVESTQNW